MQQPSPTDVTKSWITTHDVTSYHQKEIVPVKLTEERTYEISNWAFYLALDSSEGCQYSLTYEHLRFTCQSASLDAKAVRESFVQYLFAYWAALVAGISISLMRPNKVETAVWGYIPVTKAAQYASTYEMFVPRHISSLAYPWPIRGPRMGQGYARDDFDWVPCSTGAFLG